MSKEDLDEKIAEFCATLSTVDTKFHGPYRELAQEFLTEFSEWLYPDLEKEARRKLWEELNKEFGE